MFGDIPLDIILISGKENKRINLHVKLAFVILASLVFIAVLLLFVYNLTLFTSHRVDKRKLERLNQENEIVRFEITRIEGEIANLSILIDSLEEYDKKLRTYASLNPIGEDLRSMGVGGSSQFHSAEGLTTDVYSDLEGLSKTLDNLLSRSRLQKESFNNIVQYLDEKKFLREHTPSIIPVQGWFMSGFGYRIDPFTGQVKMHEGLDIAAPPGTPIIAPADGSVKFAGERRGFGLTLEIDHGYGYTTLYGHCQRIDVEEGNRVTRGDVVARVGSTGKSTGPHLHYEVRVSQIPVNPIHYILTPSITH
jgi:murein DD-endopeptidase MepM/ murein hydrolase activator NlpD